MLAEGVNPGLLVSGGDNGQQSQPPPSKRFALPSNLNSASADVREGRFRQLLYPAPWIPNPWSAGL